MNEKFFSISKEKQERIIRCAYEVFSQNSYKEASMSKIADAGGISKSLLFHYFSKGKIRINLTSSLNRSTGLYCY